MDTSTNRRLASRPVTPLSNPDILAGSEFQAVVEYAPFQKAPLKTKVKVDNRQGTIDEGAL